MFGDPELDKLYRELQKHSQNKTETKESAAPSAKTIDKNFILDLSSKKYNSIDKDLTLAEYLQKYNTVETVIEKEQKSRLKYQNSDLEKLINLVEENESQQIANPFKAMTPTKREMFISKKVEDRIEEGQQRRERNSSTSGKTLFVGDKIKRDKDVFPNLNSRNERKTIYQRIENFSNTKATVTDERFMSPLSLEQFKSNS